MSKIVSDEHNGSGYNTPRKPLKSYSILHMASVFQPSFLDYTDRGSAAYLEHTDFAESPVHRNRLSCIINMIQSSHPNRRNIRVLEIGCGLGNVAIPLAALDYPVTGIDIHAPSVDTARDRNPFPNGTFRAADLSEMDLSSYDVLILTEVLEHVSTYDQMIGYITQNMNEAACLILTVPNGWCPAEIICRPSYLMKRSALGTRVVKVIKRVLGARDLTTANPQTPHVNFFTLGRLRRLFESHGLEVERFCRQFCLWPVWETLFSERKIPGRWPERDYLRSQTLHPSLCSSWAFLLRKS